MTKKIDKLENDLYELLDYLLVGCKNQAIFRIENLIDLTRDLKKDQERTDKVLENFLKNP